MTDEPDDLMGIPLAVLPPHVRASLASPIGFETCLERDLVVAVLGSQAAHVMAHVEARSRVQRVRIAPEHEVGACAEQRVSVYGPVRGLLEAFRLLHVAMHGGEPERLTAKVLLPARLAGVVIGKGGETVREISRLSGATVDVDKSIAYVPAGPAGVQERLVKLSGAMAQVSNALAQVLLLRIDFDSSDTAAAAEAAAEERQRLRVGEGNEEYDPSNPTIQGAAAPPVATGGGGGPYGGGGGGGPYGQPAAPPPAQPQLPPPPSHLHAQPYQQQNTPPAAPPAPTAASLEAAPFGVELLVPNAGAGAIIGRGGATLHRVNRSSGAHVFVRKEAPRAPGEMTPVERAVVARGSLAQVKHAQRLIGEILRDAARNGQMPNGAASTALAAGELHALVFAPEPCAHGVLARHRERLHALHARRAQGDAANGAALELAHGGAPQRPPSPLPHAAADAALVGCVLRGGVEPLLELQRYLLAEIVQLPPILPPAARMGGGHTEPPAAKRAAYELPTPPAVAAAAAVAPCSSCFSSSSSSSSSREPPPSEAPRLKLLVPNRAAGAIIGKGGEVLRQVRTRTGCHVDVASAPNGAATADHAERLVLLSGSGRAQLAALHEVAQITSQAMMGFGLAAPPLKFLIPAEASAALVGRNGGGVKEITAASGANLIVAQQPLGGPGASPHVQGTRIVSAHGSLDGTVAAVRMCLERIYPG